MVSIDEILAGGDAGLVVLAETSAEVFQDCTPDLVRKLTEKEYNVVIITINNPSTILKKSYIKSGIDVEKVFFIDSITKYALGGLPEDKDESMYFINQPGSLTDIGIELNKSFTRLSGQKVCVIIDSINTMLIYTPSQTLIKFIHFLSNKLRLLQYLGVYICISGSIDPLLTNQLKSLSDEFIKL